jgi:prolyl oligopeptidase
MIDCMNFLWMGLLWLGGIPTMSHGREPNRWAYPETPERPVADEYHGVEVVDPYRWLEDAGDAAVRAWAEAQTALTRSVLDKDPGRPKLVETLKALHDYQTTGAPVVRGRRYFFSRREGLKNQPVVHVREGRPDAEPRVLLDPNTFSPDGTVALDWMFPSQDGALLAYGSSPDGSEMSTLKVLDVATGRHLPDTITRTRACTVAWEPSGQAFWYVRYPAKGSVPPGDEMYNRKIYRHVLGSDPESDPMVFGQGRPKIDWLGVAESEDGRYAIISSSTDWIKNDLYLKKLGDDAPAVPLAVGLDGQVNAAVFDRRVVIHTNARTPRYRVLVTDVDHLDPKDWKEIIPEPAGTAVIEAVRVVGRTLAVLTSDLAVSSLALHDLDGRKLRDVPLPAIGTASSLNGEWDRHELFYSFQSYLYPPTVFRLDTRGGDPVVNDRSTAEVDPARYEVKQVRYPSKDGTSVPMFIVRRKGLAPDGKGPTLLYGYGGFDISLTPAYKPGLRVWLDRGGVYVVANLRGGGELGREWHAAGRLGRKQNVFDDFIAAAEYLVKSGYTNPSELAIEGGSNGGLLVSACLTQRPDLFRAVVCAVPLCDMLRYHRFSIARNWVPEYGSSDDRAAFAWLRAYSPYHHVKPDTAYPAVLLLTGVSDTRVEPMHAYKMAARLQAATSSGHPVLLRVETKAGHGAGKPLTKRIEEEADKWTFLFEQLGVPERLASGR